MSWRIEKTPAALGDLAEIGTFIGRDSLRAELRFYQAAEAAFERIAEMPGLGPEIPTDQLSMSGIRRWRVPRFTNYLIFYRMSEDAVEIVRVLHGARDIERVLAPDG